MGKHGSRRNEIVIDDPQRFWVKQYMTTGYCLHFHRNLEIYGVVHGKVAVIIDGQQNILTDGQIAIVDCLENHCYEIEDTAEVFYFHIGTQYMTNFYALYPQKRLPHWLMDAEYNQRIFDQISTLVNATETIPELKRISLVCGMFSDIIEHYGAVDKLANIREHRDIVSQVVQYIYDHYQENITLETLSKQFYLSPKALSKRLKTFINVDLRVFISDIRVQRAVEMMEDPSNRGVPIDQIATMCGFSSMATFYRSYERNYSFRKLKDPQD